MGIADDLLKENLRLAKENLNLKNVLCECQTKITELRTKIIELKQELRTYHIESKIDQLEENQHDPQSRQ